MKASLQLRLLLTSLLMLTLFTGLTAAVLDKAFRKSATTAMQHRLQGQLFALLAATDLTDEGKLVFSRPLPDARYQQPDSGLYARVERLDNQHFIASQSLLGQPLATHAHPQVGQQTFTQLELNHFPHYVLDYAARWELPDGKPVTLRYQVTEDISAFQQQLHDYRTSLWGWLAASAGLLLLVQALVLRWGLQPLRRVAQELEQIENGKSQQLQGHYPRELQQLTDKINGLLKHTRSQLTRYRDSLGNMAHSLKTPLTILGNSISLQHKSTTAQADAEEQIQRIRQIVDYQLQRAATAGQANGGQTLMLATLANKICNAMKKVYADKAVKQQCDIATDLAYQADEGDMLEIMGNLLENAHKWCHSRVTIHIHRVNRDHAEAQTILRIEDDGPGIPAAVRTQVLERGKRADPGTAGHGIGLAMVQEIVLLYGGTLTIGQSTLGGAAITVTLPG